MCKVLKLKAKVLKIQTITQEKNTNFVCKERRDETQILTTKPSSAYT